MSEPEIELTRLFLRPLSEADTGFLHELWSDPDVVRYTDTTNLHTSFSQTESAVEFLLDENGKDGVSRFSWAYVACRSTDKAPCGFLHAYRDPFYPDLDTVRLKLIIRRSLWGSGYGRELIGSLPLLIRTFPEIRRVTVRYHRKNLRAERLLMAFPAYREFSERKGDIIYSMYRMS